MRYFGYLKFGSIVLTAVPAPGPVTVAPGTTAPVDRVNGAQLVGGFVADCAENDGGSSDVVAVAETVVPLHVSDEKPLSPELPNAFER